MILFFDTFVNPLYLYNGKSSYHLYVIQVDFQHLNISKEKLFNVMREKKNIGLQVHYIPINKQPFYKSIGYGSESTPEMDNYYQKSFSIPMYPLLKQKEQEYVVQSLFEVLSS